MTNDHWLGVLEVLSGGSGFIWRKSAGYVPSKEDVYVSGKLVSRFGLRSGDELHGSVGGDPKNGKAPPLSRLELVNGRPPNEAKERPKFDRLGALHPEQQLKLECDIRYRGEPDYTNRVIDLFCPLGKGQRAMIVSPALRPIGCRMYRFSPSAYVTSAIRAERFGSYSTVEIFPGMSFLSRLKSMMR